MILYFSGTGNSKFVASQLSKIIGEELVSINDMLKNKAKGEMKSEEKLIFVVPTYAWRIPRVVRDWIIGTSFKTSPRVWFVMTCGSEIGNSAKYNKALCEKKGFEYFGTAGVVMPENYILMFDSPEDAEIQEIIGKAKVEIEKIGKVISEERVFPTPMSNFQDKLMSGVVNTLFYPVFVRSKDFYSNEKCTGCGACERVCPLNNIKIKNNKPLWENNCTHCTACISYCPETAIEYGKKTLNKRRYICKN